jgi:predicted unusual protein kinase regulating ubiquinone biosynthesis (AarF/ABC1/UbiB family)
MILALLSISWSFTSIFTVKKVNHVSSQLFRSSLAASTSYDRTKTTRSDLRSQNYTITNKNTPAYDGEKLQRYYSSRPFEVWTRLIDIGSPIIGWWISKQFDERFVFPLVSESARDELRKVRAVDLKDSIVQSRSIAIIKSGQALSLRPDIVKNKLYLDQLALLQDAVGSFDNNVAMNIIREELKVDHPEDLFDFEPSLPIASASIGQVYRARIKSTGQYVAVKVQRPDALTTSPVDMFILRNLAAYIKQSKRFRSDLVAIADLFGAQLFEELDYNQEALNCRRFKSFYGNIPGIYIPDVNLELTTQRVLVMEWVDGEKGPWTSRDGEKMLTIGLQCSVLQLLGTGYFHSDPHRGNLLKTPTNELAYLDFGMMSEVEAENRYALIGAVLGIVNRDFEMIVRNLRKLDFFPPSSDEVVMVEALTRSVTNAMDDGEGASLNFTKLSQNIQSAAGELPFRLPPFYSLIIRTLTILEGLAINVDPSFRLIRGAYPFIIKQILDNPSTEMVKLLEAVLLKRDEGSRVRIQWDKLEQFISIASKADAAIKGNFNAMKTSYSPSSNRNASFEITVQILDFLLSSNGQFLREPLINELVDIFDSIGLTIASFVSVASLGVIPKPSQRPDRQRLNQLLLFLESILAVPASADERSGGSSRTETERLRVLQRLVGQIIDSLTRINNRGTVNDYLPIVSRASELFQPVAIRLADRSVRRTIRSFTRPGR